MDSPTHVDMADVDQPLQTPAPPPIEDDDVPRLPEKLPHHDNEPDPLESLSTHNGVATMPTLGSLQMPAYEEIQPTSSATAGEIATPDFRDRIVLPPMSNNDLGNGPLSVTSLQSTIQDDTKFNVDHTEQFKEPCVKIEEQEINLNEKTAPEPKFMPEDGYSQSNDVVHSLSQETSYELPLFHAQPSQQQLEQPHIQDVAQPMTDHEMGGSQQQEPNRTTECRVDQDVILSESKSSPSKKHSEVFSQSEPAVSPPLTCSYDTMEPRTPISTEVQILLRETIDIIDSHHRSDDCRSGKRSAVQQQFGDFPEVEIQDSEAADEVPLSPEPQQEAETLVDDFVEEFTNEDKRILFSEEAEDSVPIKEVIINAKMDDEVTEVLQTYMKSQFGEVRKRTAMHVMAADERIASYQCDIRKMSIPLLRMAQQLDENPDDIDELRRTAGNILCLMLMLNERMLHDRRRAILNFFERPDDLADEHRLPRRMGDRLFGKRFCCLNGMGFTKRRPRRKPAPRVVYQPAPPPPQPPKSKLSTATGSVTNVKFDAAPQHAFNEEYDEELDDDEEEAISDEDWKVSEDEDADPEEEEIDSDLDSEEKADIGGRKKTKMINGTNAMNGGKQSVEDIWSESVRLAQLADAAVEGLKAKRRMKKEKKLKKDKLKKAKKERKKRVVKESGTPPAKRGRKKKVKEQALSSTPPPPLAPPQPGMANQAGVQSMGPLEEKPKGRRRRRKTDGDDGEETVAFKRRKKDGPTIERKIDPHCEYCDFEADRRHLIMHVRKEHPDKMIQCDQCNKKFAFKVSLWNHVVIMHGTAKFKCDQCTRSFRSEEKLRMHSFMHSENKPFACEICGKGCLTKRHLDAHVLIHEQRQQLFCQMCDRHFATNHNYRNHMKLHTGQKDFFCDICNAGFPIKARLTQHKRLHHSGEQYVCDTCGKAFKARHILNDHKALRHSNEKAWVCEICGAGFKLKSVLVRHLKTHSDERPYHCDICDKAFKDRSTLGVHRKTHSTDRPFLCEQCGMSFKRNAERKKHNCMGRMVHIPEDSSQSHHGQMGAPNQTANIAPSHTLPPQIPNSHGGVGLHVGGGGGGHSTHHLVATHRPIPLSSLMHPHPATLIQSPATPGTSLQAQLMQLLDEGLHAAGTTHQNHQQQQQHHSQQAGNFSVN